MLSNSLILVTDSSQQDEAEKVKKVLTSLGFSVDIKEEPSVYMGLPEVLVDRFALVVGILHDGEDMVREDVEILLESARKLGRAVMVCHVDKDIDFHDYKSVGQKYDKKILRPKSLDELSHIKPLVPRFINPGQADDKLA